jgi:hypothetical protein
MAHDTLQPDNAIVYFAMRAFGLVHHHDHNHYDHHQHISAFLAIVF